MPKHLTIGQAVQGRGSVQPPPLEAFFKQTNEQNLIELRDGTVETLNQSRHLLVERTYAQGLLWQGCIFVPDKGSFTSNNVYRFADSKTDAKIEKIQLRCLWDLIIQKKASLKRDINLVKNNYVSMPIEKEELNLVI